MTPEERAAKREAVIQGMIDRGYTRERAEEIVGKVTRALFHPTEGAFRDGQRRP